MNFNDNKPIYRQIIDFCYGCILSDLWQPECRTPSVREMASELVVNTHTVMKAYETLQAKGIIFPRRGMGYYLSADARELVMEARREEFFSETLPSLVEQMKQLGISPQELINHISLSDE